MSLSFPPLSRLSLLDKTNNLLSLLSSSSHLINWLCLVIWLQLTLCLVGVKVAEWMMTIWVGGQERRSSVV